MNSKAKQINNSKDQIMEASKCCSTNSISILLSLGGLSLVALSLLLDILGGIGFPYNLESVLGLTRLLLIFTLGIGLAWVTTTEILVGASLGYSSVSWFLLRLYLLLAGDLTALLALDFLLLSHCRWWSALVVVVWVSGLWACCGTPTLLLLVELFVDLRFLGVEHLLALSLLLR